MTDADRAREIEIELELLESEGAPPAAPAPAPAEKPGYVAAALAGIQNLGAMGWGDELGAAMQGGLAKVTGTGDYLETYRQARGENRAESKAAKEAHKGVYYGAGLPFALAAGLAMPGLKAAQGAGLGIRAGYGAINGLVQGGIAGAGESEADTAGGVAKDAGVSALIGGGLGAGLGAAATGLGRLGSNARKGVAAIDEKVARKGAQEAAAETAKLRSAAGHASQDTYRQLEHLRDTGASNILAPEEAQIAAQLEKELGGKAADKLLPSALEKARTAAAYAEGLSTEAARAEAAAASKLGWSAAKAQILPRALRYGLPALGGALGLGGHGGLAGAGVGALAGAGMRPMMHSLLRAAKDPSVAKPLLQAAGFALEDVAAPAIQRAAISGLYQLSPEIAAQIAALRGQEPTPTKEHPDAP